MSNLPGPRVWSRRTLISTAAGLAAATGLAGTARRAQGADGPPAPPPAPPPPSPAAPPPAPGATAATEATRTPPAAVPLHLLVLGGTAFLGPEFVARATARGHRVTLFNRGRTRPDLFPDLEKLRGDRNGDVAALVGRRFDAVLDTSAYVPAHVRRVREALGEGVAHYTLVSTLSVYAGFGASRTPVHEETPVATLADPTTEQVTNETYGPLKARCEAAAQEGWPGRVSVVRPGLIVGPGDPTDRFTYWPVRVARGGEVLAPGDGEDGVQVIDVRDLAAFLLHATEAKAAGVFNAVGFEGPLTFREFLHGAKCALRHDVSFTWVAAPALAAARVAPWHALPVWLPPEGNARVENQRARAAGLAFRPVAQTIADTWAWYRESGRDVAWGTGRAPGLSAAREAEVLAAQRGR